jgi:4-amino-4-deoxy-L-arabinose transferase-like glycosyltransferase
MRDRVALWTAGIAALLHGAFANRYNLFRDELYFIVCGRHAAFGYVDQPPLVPLLAAAGYAAGGQTWAVRIPAILAAAALPFIVVAFVRRLGGRDAAAWTGGLAAAFAPMFAGLTATLNTNLLELVAWTAVAYALARAAIDDDGHALVPVGILAGLALEAKYAIPLWFVGLGIGLVLTPQRRVFAKRELWIACAVAAAIALPSVLWQLAHGLPFAELVHNAHLKDRSVGAVAFMANQILVYGPFFAPLWLFAIVAPFFIASLRAVRFVAIGYAITAIAIVAGGGKDYYLAPAVPALLAIGAVGFQTVLRSARIRGAYAALAALAAVPLLPIALPILDPPVLLRYEATLHLVPQQQERADAAEALPSTFADMLGWHEFVREVGAAYASLSPDEKRSTIVLVDNYGEAASIDLYGAALGLPHAYAGQNAYYFWGPPPADDARNILRVQRDAAALQPYCTQMRVLGTTHAAYARSFENGNVIAYCRGVHPALGALWSQLKTFI